MVQKYRLLVFLMLVSTLSFAQGKKPNFSGRWEIDRARSKIISTDKLQAGSILQIIEHNGSVINIMRIINGSEGEEKLNIDLTTDGVQRSRKVDEHELIFQSRWHGDRLVTVVQYSDSQSVSWIEEVWELSKDGNYLTIELNLEAEKNSMKEKLVYRRMTHEKD